MKKIFLIVPIFILPFVLSCAPLEMVKLRWFDAFVATPKESGLFTVLNITEEDLDERLGWPFPRTELAKIQEEIVERGAIGVGWVISFPQPGRWNGDKLFQLIAKNNPSVFAMFESPNREYPKTTGTVIMGPDPEGLFASGVLQNTPRLQINEGIVSAQLDTDGILRRMPLVMRSPDGWIPSFGIQVLKILAGQDTYGLKTNKNGIEAVRVRDIPPIQTDSRGTRWISWIVPRETSLAELDVANKFVFIGVTAKGVMPQVSTPVGLLNPHHIQAAFAESLINPSSPFVPEFALLFEILVCLASVSLVIASIGFLGTITGITLSAVVFLSTALTGALVVHNGYLVDVSQTLLFQIVAASLAFYLRFREQWQLRQQIKKQFEHYLDPRQVAELQKNPDKLRLGGDRAYATFLFTDVRGFTSLSEQLEPEEVTYVMNRALTVQSDAVKRNGGLVDKYIGDAMMAIWNVPLPMQDHESKALQCARDIEAGMVALNEELTADKKPNIQIGIGINTGDAIVGNMGSATRFDYTAIGDAVNTAARLESATKAEGVNVLIGANTAHAVQGGLRYHNDISVKGKKEGLKVYTWDSK